jgi:hypothetical protein
MENPRKQIVMAVQFVIVGWIIGFVPGLIRTDQLRREMKTTLANTAKQLPELRRTVVYETARADLETQSHRLMQDGWMQSLNGNGDVTILVDTDHPYGGGQLTVFGSNVILPPKTANVSAGPIWVIPRHITPQVVDGILSASYTHVSPDGKNDGWHTARSPQ